MSSRRRPFTLAEAAGLDNPLENSICRRDPVKNPGKHFPRTGKENRTDGGENRSDIKSSLSIGIKNSNKKPNGPAGSEAYSPPSTHQECTRAHASTVARFENVLSNRPQESPGPKSDNAIRSISLLSETSDNRPSAPIPIVTAFGVTVDLENDLLEGDDQDSVSPTLDDQESLSQRDLAPTFASENSMDVISESMLNEHAMPVEPTDVARKMEQRQKQIVYGKNTIGYFRYTRLVPRDARRKGDPSTPDKNLECSKRCWDGLVRAWRRRLHAWDPPLEAMEEEVKLMSESRGIHPAQERALALLKEQYSEELGMFDGGESNVAWIPETHDHGLVNPFDSSIPNQAELVGFVTLNHSEELPSKMARIDLVGEGTDV
ncbi:hypothetical protein HDU93_003955 [Gonapodya sp. JEL0774]|nr:hypothetical protein HDU93_003955 [Gonapodya sp. JEL0774]